MATINIPEVDSDEPAIPVDDLIVIGRVGMTATVRDALVLILARLSMFEEDQQVLIYRAFEELLNLHEESPERVAMRLERERLGLRAAVDRDGNCLEAVA
jgi:hypothetical protein